MRFFYLLKAYHFYRLISRQKNKSVAVFLTIILFYYTKYSIQWFSKWINVCVFFIHISQSIIYQSSLIYFFSRFYFILALCFFSWFRYGMRMIDIIWRKKNGRFFSKHFLFLRFYSRFYLNFSMTGNRIKSIRHSLFFSFCSVHHQSLWFSFHICINN